MDLDLIEHDIDTPRRAESQASGLMDEIETPVKPIKAEDFDLWKFAEQQMAREGKKTDVQRIMIVMGDNRVGKSTFLENLDTKGTSSKVRSFGLQYSYAEMIYMNQNIVANYYEVSGGLKSCHLMQYPINSTNIEDASVFVLIDCSSLENAYNHLEQWLPAIYEELEKKAQSLSKEGKRDLVDKLRARRIEKLKGSGDFKSEKDYKLTLIPLTIVAHKYDLYEANEPYFDIKLG